MPADRKIVKTRTSHAERAWLSLREQIFSNKLPPGFRALETELALRLRMSRTPVHEALIRLQNEGLVRVEPRRGVVVLPIEADDLRQIYEVVIAVETEAVNLAARRNFSAVSLAPLLSEVAAMESAVELNDRTAWADADDRFHRLLLELCGNRRLAEIANTHREQVRRARFVTLYRRMLPMRSAQCHRATYEAIAAGDGALAMAIHRSGWEAGAAELTEILRKLPAGAA